MEGPKEVGEARVEIGDREHGEDLADGAGVVRK